MTALVWLRVAGESTTGTRAIAQAARHLDDGDDVRALIERRSILAREGRGTGVAAYREDRSAGLGCDGLRIHPRAGERVTHGHAPRSVGTLQGRVQLERALPRARVKGPGAASEKEERSVLEIEGVAEGALVLLVRHRARHPCAPGQCAPRRAQALSSAHSGWRGRRETQRARHRGSGGRGATQRGKSARRVTDNVSASANICGCIHTGQKKEKIVYGKATR